MNKRTREEIIKMNIEFSQLLKKEEKLGAEYKTLKEDNGFYLKKNKEYEEENARI